jgi:glutamine---fructose-6-phosphate transaminase (isomerizing)
MQLGLLTAREIAGQPDSWQATLDTVTEATTRLRRFQQGGDPNEIVFSGCGSSYYLAISGAFLLESLSGIHCRAMPASEIINYGEHLWKRSTRKRELIAISRSGATSETVQAVRTFRKHAWGPVLSIGCYDHTPMHESSDLAITLQAAQEESVVMTKAFTSILLAIQYIAGLWTNNAPYLQELSLLPKLSRKTVPQAQEVARKIADKRRYNNYFFLGAGPRYGLALEGTLKVREMALQNTEAYHPLEIRHGPISVVEDGALVTLLQGRYGRDYERALLSDLKLLGADILAVPGETEGGPLADADFTLGAAFTGNEFSLLPLYLPVVQYLGLFTAIKAGVDPDTPKNLSQVVEL